MTKTFIWLFSPGSGILRCHLLYAQRDVRLKDSSVSSIGSSSEPARRAGYRETMLLLLPCMKSQQFGCTGVLSNECTDHTDTSLLGKRKNANVMMNLQLFNCLSHRLLKLESFCFFAAPGANLTLSVAHAAVLFVSQICSVLLH